MPLALQVKLLRFLQDGKLERVGGRESLTVDTRIVAATNINPAEAIQRGAFREDLFYRLSVVQIAVPPLREREDDIVMMAQAFLWRYRETLNKRVVGLSDEARQAIRSYGWPGNVRELENRIKRAVIMAKASLVQPADLELPWEQAPAAPLTLKEARSKLEKDLIHRALICQNWNISRAAEDLGITRQALHESLHKYGITKPAGQQAPGPGPTPESENPDISEAGT